MPWAKNVHKQLGKGIHYREIRDKFGVSASAACEKVNTVGIDENLFRLVPVPGHSARVLPLELVPVPVHGAKISARAPAKGFVQIGARAAVWTGPYSLTKSALYFVEMEINSIYCMTLFTNEFEFLISLSSRWL